MLLSCFGACQQFSDCPPDYLPAEHVTLVEAEAPGEIELPPEGDHFPILGARMTLMKEGDPVQGAFYSDGDNEGTYVVGYEGCGDSGEFEVRYEAEGYDPLVLDFTDSDKTVGLVLSSRE